MKMIILAVTSTVGQLLPDFSFFQLLQKNLGDCCIYFFRREIFLFIGRVLKYRVATSSNKVTFSAPAPSKSARGMAAEMPLPGAGPRLDLWNEVATILTAQEQTTAVSLQCPDSVSTAWYFEPHAFTRRWAAPQWQSSYEGTSYGHAMVMPFLRQGPNTLMRPNTLNRAQCTPAMSAANIQNNAEACGLSHSAEQLHAELQHDDAKGDHGCSIAEDKPSVEQGLDCGQSVQRINR